MAHSCRGNVGLKVQSDIASSERNWNLFLLHVGAEYSFFFATLVFSNKVLYGSKFLTHCEKIYR